MSEILEDFQQAVFAKLSEIQLHITQKIFKDVVAYTPIETGRARAGWNVSLGVPDPEVPVVGKGSYPEPVMEVSRIVPFSVSYVSNNLPYIEQLEFGDSQRAAYGMLRRALQNILEEGGV